MLESPEKPKRPHFYDEMCNNGDWNRFKRKPMKPIAVVYEEGGKYYLPPFTNKGRSPKIRIYSDGAIIDDYALNYKIRFFPESHLKEVAAYAIIHGFYLY